MTQELTATSVLALFSTTKEQRQQFANEVLSAIKDGDVNPLDLHINIKKMEDTIKQITSSEEYMSLVLDEVEKYGEKSIEKNNAKIEIKEVGVKYDYSMCDDATYNDLDAQKKQVEVKIKERQKFLQLIPEGGTVDPETGGMVYRAARTSTTSAVITLK